MGWQLIMELSGGIGLVLLLRWYWWRVSAWSEIAALSSSAVTAVYLQKFPNSPLLKGLSAALERVGFKVDAWGVNIILIVAVTTAVWLTVTFVAPADDRDKLLAFYRQVRPGGFWGPIARLNGRAYKLQVYPFLGWALALVMILSFLLGVGKLIFMSFAAGAAYLAAGAAAAFLLSKTINKIDWEGQ
jgi:hypothetical protein